KGISSEGATEKVASSEISESKDTEETSASPETVTTAENTVESTDALFTIETIEQQAGSIEETEEITTPAIPATTEGDESFVATTSEASSDVSSPHNDDEMFLVKAVGEDGVGVSDTEQNKSTEHVNSSEIPSTTQIPEKAFASSEIGPPGTAPESQENTVLAVEEIEQEGKNVKDNTGYNEENASSNFATTSEIPPTGETMASSVTFEHDLITDMPSEK
ncbi:unnamed protein product, partial [Anisakis simplex]|uniref:Mucin-associated surface protein (MASP) n=1 Tax=Anisakis simplex TaxID=6269 RepID=A0A0M3JIL2_ANISI